MHKFFASYGNRAYCAVCGDLKGTHQAMASYILRGIDPDLWRQVKSKAALKGLSIREVIETFLRSWVTKP
jgi:hypothetical protein